MSSQQCEMCAAAGFSQSVFPSSKSPIASDYLYHYTSAESALKILESERFRLSHLERTNDLAESEPTGLQFSLANDQSDPGVHFIWLYNQADQQIRKPAHIGCFTQDWQPHPNLGDERGAGWSHHSMWANYADGHEGMCLQFSREKLVQAVTQIAGDRLSYSRPVTYSSSFSVHRPSLSLNKDCIHRFGFDAVMQLFIHKNIEQLYYYKHPDWHNEDEFRFLILGAPEDTIEIPIGDALTGVFLGHKFRESHIQSLNRIVARYSGLLLCQLNQFSNSFWPLPYQGKLIGDPEWHSEAPEWAAVEYESSLEDRVRKLEEYLGAADESRRRPPANH